MKNAIVFSRENGWLPQAIREGENLRLSFVGGADALHDPRSFSIPIEESHLAVLQGDLARHLILWSALRPLCDSAGIRDPLDEAAAVALLNPILLANPDEVNAFLHHTRLDRLLLVAHGARLELFDSGRIVESMAAGTQNSDWQRANSYHADERRAQRGVKLSPLDAAILKFTGQYQNGSTVPHRNLRSPDPALLPEVMRVIATAEGVCEGMGIARDARRGPRGTDKRDWEIMDSAVDAALHSTHPELAEDAVKTVRFLMCSEATDRAQTQPFDIVAAGDETVTPPRGCVLTLSDDQGATKTWRSGDDRTAVEAFWGFVAHQIGPHNEVFTLEDEAKGEGIQLHFYADSIARVETVSRGAIDATTEHRVEYGLVDDLAHYRTLVRGYVAGGFGALDGRARWIADSTAFEAARRRRGRVSG